MPWITWRRSKYAPNVATNPTDREIRGSAEAMSAKDPPSEIPTRPTEPSTKGNLSRYRTERTSRSMSSRESTRNRSWSCGTNTTRPARAMAKFSLEPLEDRIVVKPGEEEETTVSGIVIPDTAKEKPQEGEVIAVGPGRFEDGQRAPLDVKVGDKVIYSKYGGTEVKVEGDEYLILSARDVLAVVKK